MCLTSSSPWAVSQVRLREIHFGTTIGLGKDSEYATAAKVRHAVNPTLLLVGIWAT